MLIRKAKYKKIRVWQRREVSPEVNGCDNCGEEIKEYPNEAGRLDMTVWPNQDNYGDDRTQRYHFCSWKCVLQFIPKIKSTYFASLPHLMFDSTGKKSASELIELLNQGEGSQRSVASKAKSGNKSRKHKN